MNVGELWESIRDDAEGKSSILMDFKPVSR